VARLELEQHLKNSSGQGCPAKYKVGRARIFAEAKLATLGRASGDARDKTRQDPLKLEKI
jgi:hypothetical protein